MGCEETLTVRLTEAGVQRAICPLAGVFRGWNPLNGGGWTRTSGDVSRGIYSRFPFRRGG